MSRATSSGWTGPPNAFVRVRISATSWGRPRAEGRAGRGRRDTPTGHLTVAVGEDSARSSVDRRPWARALTPKFVAHTVGPAHTRLIGGGRRLSGVGVDVVEAPFQERSACMFDGSAEQASPTESDVSSPEPRGLGVIPVVGVLDHGRARYAEFPRYLPVAQALAVELPDTLSDTHRCRHFLSSREPSVWLTGAGIYQGTGRCRCSHSTSAITADTVQIERSGCSGTSADSEHLYSITHRSAGAPRRAGPPVSRGAAA